ncbi:13558_t:CDS:2 [Dentiscutata erythropus]|uniref:13558_t:CDS:1 n=1 Tax=Dentiscutata erythropus TaxID=1348616 RepID=A0A9N8ZJ09_9GLOM|nr:13558_t:CDS:2 [Dentiscutata erythropus]
MKRVGYGKRNVGKRISQRKRYVGEKGMSGKENVRKRDVRKRSSLI